MSFIDEISDPEKEEKEAHALEVFKELAKECDEGMIPRFVSYRDDLHKATFYYFSDHRVDFRELVKELSSKLSISVEMRQINEREQASLIGGIGPCGQELCCCKMKEGCCKKNATIKMAKNQDLSLNPTKISGMCGRLMCCLRFEDDYYKEFKFRAPKVNSFVKTPDGDGKVIGQDALHETITLRVDEDKPRKIKLDELEANKKGDGGFAVGKKAWDKAENSMDNIKKSAANVTIDTSLFTGTDRVANARDVKLADKPRPTRRRGDLRRKRKDRKQRRSSRSSATFNSSKTASRPGGNSSATKLSSPKTITRPKKENREGTKLKKRRTRKISGSK